MSMSTIRMVLKDKDGTIREILEMRELVTPPNIALLMRRKYVSGAISKALAVGGTVTVEAK